MHNDDELVEGEMQIFVNKRVSLVQLPIWIQHNKWDVERNIVIYLRLLFLLFQANLPTKFGENSFIPQKHHPTTIRKT